MTSAEYMIVGMLFLILANQEERVRWLSLALSATGILSFGISLARLLT